MIKKAEFPKVIERYEYVISLDNKMKYEMRWKSKVLEYYTCGAQGHEVECLELVPGSLSFRKVFDNGLLGDELNVEQFNMLNPDEQLDFKCNCHGFSFANGKFFITNEFVSSILEDEFIEITDREEIDKGNYDVVCFRDDLTREWVHSCKYKFELYIQKEGMRKFSIHRSIGEIANIDEYSNTQIHYFKRKEWSCPGICLNAIGEQRIKTFANNTI